MSELTIDGFLDLKAKLDLLRDLVITHPDERDEVEARLRQECRRYPPLGGPVFPIVKAHQRVPPGQLVWIPAAERQRFAREPIVDLEDAFR